MSSKVYPEVTGYLVRNESAEPPKFPLACPVCGALAMESPMSLYTFMVQYHCGGTYTHKPQCQNHTEVFWGMCKAN